MLSLTISQGALALVVVVVAFGGTLLMLARIGRRAAHRSLERESLHHHLEPLIRDSR